MIVLPGDIVYGVHSSDVVSTVHCTISLHISSHIDTAHSVSDFTWLIVNATETEQHLVRCRTIVYFFYC
jgi:hypothetical protein